MRDVIVITPGRSVVATAVKGRSAPRGSMLPEAVARGSQADMKGMGRTSARSPLLKEAEPLVVDPTTSK